MALVGTIKSTAPKDEEKRTFYTSVGVYCYTMVLFGPKNAGATYQRHGVTDVPKGSSKFFGEDQLIRRFIPDLSAKILPLMQILKKSECLSGVRIVIRHS